MPVAMSIRPAHAISRAGVRTAGGRDGGALNGGVALEARTVGIRIEQRDASPVLKLVLTGRPNAELVADKALLRRGPWVMEPAGRGTCSPKACASSVKVAWPELRKKKEAPRSLSMYTSMPLVTV